MDKKIIDDFFETFLDSQFWLHMLLNVVLPIAMIFVFVYLVWLWY